jgi:2,3-bisphosphoglycerate-dependent phosphoglycerate mutase
VAAHHPPDVIYASPLIRTAETAQILAAQMHLPVQFEDDLMEWNNGVLAGLLRTEADQKYPPPATPRKPHECVEGGETDIAFRARAEMIWSRLLHQTPENQRVAVVAHGGVINQLFHCFLQLPLQANLWLVTGDTGVHLWRVRGETRWVLLGNSLVHLLEGPC